MTPSLFDRLFVFILKLLPQHLLSRGIYMLTRWDWPPFKNAFIRLFIRLFKVEMQEAATPWPEDYPTFNAFFTRTLRQGARPICEDGQLACPADGRLSAFGDIRHGQLLQAKGMDYSLEELLGGDKGLAERFTDGSFATVYLSPKDYHRVHMPLSGSLQETLHVPGRLFSVNAATARTLPRLFSRNERVVTVFETEIGPMAVILVGAIFVGCMDTVWAGTLAPADLRISRWPEPEQKVQLARGEEMGRFNMGSTVILLFAKDALDWGQDLREGQKVRMGEALGTCRTQM
jgi:phosphatidylserine decarboxylase